MTSIKAKVDILLDLLQAEKIEIETIKTHCFQGIPDEKNLRPLCWRVLLNYLPLHKSQWPDYLSRQRQFYSSLVEDLIVNCARKKPSLEAENGHTDHPLNPNPQSGWTLFFKENEILAQINKDVRRLCPEISFFQQETEFPSKIVAESQIECLSQRVNNILLESEVLTKSRSGATNLVASRKMAVEQYASLTEGREAHWQVVERILFIYAKLNPGIKYVQVD